MSSGRPATSSVTDWSVSPFSTVGDRRFTAWPSDTGLSGGALRFWQFFAHWPWPVWMNTTRAFWPAGRVRPSMWELMSAGPLLFSWFCCSSFSGLLAAAQGTAQPDCIRISWLSNSARDDLDDLFELLVK